jgi:hypothetical protein
MRGRATVTMAMVPAMLIGFRAEHPAGAAEEAGDAARPAIDALRRVVERFDFEPADGVHRQFPAKFRRYIATDQGFPGFGTILLSDDEAAEGRWSLHFTIDGGSLAARVPPGLIGVLPLKDYLLTARVRTEGLEHSRARVAAWMTDAHGQTIAGSRCESTLVETAGAWTTIVVPILGDFEEAADLVIALEALQPRQFLTSHAGIDRPALEDVRGDVWFDDVTLWQLPRIELSTDSPVNVISAPAVPAIHLEVDDPADAPLVARLTVTDWRGEAILSRSFTPPRGGERRTFELPEIPFGWYQAVVEIEGPQGAVGSTRLQFVHLDSTGRSVDAARREFAANVSSQQLARPDECIALLRGLGVGHARLGIGPGGPGTDPGVSTTLRRALEAIAAQHEVITLSFERLPEDMARALDIPAEQVALGLALDEQSWRSALEPALTDLAHLTRRWQLGVGRAGSMPPTDDLPETVARIATACSSMVAASAISVPWPIEREVDQALAAALDADIVVGYEIHPRSIEAYAASWSDARPGVSATIEPLPVDTYATEDRIADLVIRTLHARRAGVNHVSIAAPWSKSDDRRPSVMPDAVFGAWAGLSERVAGRRVAGDFPAGEGIQCWILEDPAGVRGALVAWNESAPVEEAILAATLGDGPVQVIDAFGNRRAAEPEHGRHSIALDAVPVFIEGVDLRLAQFMATIAFSPTTIPSTHREHALELGITNPWNVQLSGTVRVLDPAMGEFSPRSQPFSIAPGESARLPFSLLPRAGAINGRHEVTLKFDLAADDRRSFATRADVHVGVPTLDAWPTWTVAENPMSGDHDLLVTLHVANREDRPVNLDVTLTAPGVSQQRRLIAALGPGQSAVRQFHVSGGAALLAGQRLRLSVEDRDSGSRLNQALDIPELALAGADR